MARLTVPDDRRPGGAHVELKDITKSFGGARALQGVSLQIRRGSIHALVGENGAGKSTLGKIISGVITPDHGQMRLRGEPVHFHSPREAIRAGIVLIAQEMSIVTALSVAENVFLGDEPSRSGFVARRTLARRYTELAASAGFDLPGAQPAAGLRTADQQKVEILRALGRNAELIVMDEPSAALSQPDTRKLHEIIRGLARAGTTVVLVSHFLREVLDLADQITVLRDGHLVHDAPAASQTEESLLAAMLGRSLGAAFPPRQPPADDAPIVLSARDVRAPGVDGISLDVRAGEIVGLAGLVGAGRSELARALSGAAPMTEGTVTVEGGPRLQAGRHLLGRARADSPQAALRAGIAMIPESRQDSGLLPGRPIAENVSLASLRRRGEPLTGPPAVAGSARSSGAQPGSQPSDGEPGGPDTGQPTLSRLGFVRRRAERNAVTKILGQVAAGSPAQSAPVGTLSGGNQQKVLFARMLMRRPRVLVADEPTRGVDVGAKRTIYDLLTELAADGLGVLLISSDVEEILGLTHRVLVLRAGRIAAELRGDDMTEAAILAAAFGAAERGM